MSIKNTTAEEIHNRHMDLHAMRLPHDCREWERREKELMMQELFTEPADYLVQMAVLHRGIKN